MCYLYNLQENNAHKNAVICPFVRSFSHLWIPNKCTEFYEILYEYYLTERHPTVLRGNFLHLVCPSASWRTNLWGRSNTSANCRSAVSAETTVTISSKLINVTTKIRSNDSNHSKEGGAVLGFNAVASRYSVISQNIWSSILKIHRALWTYIHLNGHLGCQGLNYACGNCRDLWDRLHSPTSFYVFIEAQTDQNYTQIFANYYTIRCVQ
jgi:hypothetical protein